MAIDEWLASVREEARKLAEFKGDLVLVFHNDADGLASGAIAKASLERLGKRPTLYCLEKMYTEVIEKIHEAHPNSWLIYLDIGSGEVPLLESQGQRITILDHHKTTKPKTERVKNLDPELFGISGDKEACGASVAYLFFREIAEIKDLADLALVGAQEIPGPLAGLNRLAMEEANFQELASGSLKLARFGKIASSVARDLTILGSVGYYQGGPELGLTLAENGYNQRIKNAIKEFEARRKEAVNKALYSLKLTETRNVQFFDVGDAFKGMGTKTIGTFCSFLLHRRIAPDKILLGFMNVEKVIPRLNGVELELAGDYSKVSTRAPEIVKAKISSGEIPGLGNLLAKACQRVGGFGDGHDFAASGVIPKNKKEALVQAIERELGEKQTGLGSWI